MKQTPIPEKIKIPIYAQKDIGGWILEKNINSLIDVVTEQQKDIELLDTYIKDHNIWHYTEKSYTAMRSTGEFCNCKNRRSVTTGTNDRRTLCGDCGKPIKSQEDIRENIGKIINEYWGNGYQIGKHGAFSEKTMETDTVVDRILAIVKGE